MLRVLVCDDDPMIRDALCEVLRAEPDIEVVAVARNADEAVAMAREHAPAVVVLDVRMPGGGARAAREIHDRDPAMAILAFSAYADLAAIAEIRRLGPVDYLHKGARNAEIVAAVRRLAGTSSAD